MRNLPNESPVDPVRRCILSGERAAPHALVRLALGPDNRIAVDIRSKAPGRGAWIGVTRDELETAIAKGRLKAALARAFKTGDILIPDNLADMVQSGLERTLLDRLGLESRSGGLITGFEKIDVAARRGQVHLLLHASDASTDGCRKLDQAWRVGRDAEGSGLQGPVLPLDRDPLSMALGRENMVHVALIRANGAMRVANLLRRLLHYQGKPDAFLASLDAAPLPQAQAPEPQEAAG